MRAALVTIGDELLIGQVVNTNASWIGARLSAAGIDLVEMVTVGDTEEDIRQALGRMSASADLVILTGGLGPTHDDLTRESVAGYFGLPLRLDESVVAHLRERFARRNRPMPERNMVQAMAPEGFVVLPNPRGTAPGLWHTYLHAGRPRMLAIVPGVPSEMRWLIEEEVLPRVARYGKARTIVHRTLLTTDIGESSLQELLPELGTYLDERTRLAYLPGNHGVRLRISARGAEAAEVQARTARLEAYLRDRLERFIYGVDDDRLEMAVGEMLRHAGLTLACAESCSGGHLLDRLTDIPGSSAYVVGGVVAYYNRIKREVLGVDPADLEREGAVSEAVARQMAVGIRKLMGTDIGVSTTGIAGPGGGTPEKPVGTVWVGYADGAVEEAHLFQLGQERELNKDLGSTSALGLIRRRLLARAAAPGGEKAA